MKKQLEAQNKKKSHPDKQLVRGVSFLGIRTQKAKELRELMENILGLQIIHEENNFVAYRALNGDRIEIFGPDDSKHIHFTTGPVGGFEVADIKSIKILLEKNRIETLTEIMGREGGTQWVHFKGPDGNVYEIVQHSDFKE